MRSAENVSSGVHIAHNIALNSAGVAHYCKNMRGERGIYRTRRRRIEVDGQRGVGQHAHTACRDRHRVNGKDRQRSVCDVGRHLRQRCKGREESGQSRKGPLDLEEQNAIERRLVNRRGTCALTSLLVCAHLLTALPCQRYIILLTHKYFKPF